MPPGIAGRLPTGRDLPESSKRIHFAGPGGTNTGGCSKSNGRTGGGG